MTYFIEAHLPILKPKAAVRYMTSSRKLHPFFKDLYLDEITSANLRAFEEARRQHDGVAAATVIRDLRCLSSCIEEIMAARDVDMPNPVNPYLRRRRRRGLKEGPPRTRYLTHEDETALLAACRDLETSKRNWYRGLHDMVAFAIDTGLRREEQMSLTWGQVDLTRHEVLVLIPDARCLYAARSLVPHLLLRNHAE